MSLVIAIPVTLCAALAFATSSVLEQRSTKEVRPRGPLSPRLLLDLVKRPLWLAAIVLNAVGSVLQIVALRFGELATVQPLLVCNLLFAVLIASFAVWRRPPDGIILLGVVACAAGLACFLAVARPSGGTDTVSFTAVLPLGVALAAVLAVCLAIAIHGPPSVRPLVLAFATGVDFGVTAFLLKLVSHALSQGGGGAGRLWPLLAVAITGPLGFLLSQNAFQAGILISPVLSVITVVDPLVSIGIAVLLLHEKLASSPRDIAVEVISLAVMAAGIVALSRRAPHVATHLPRDSHLVGQPENEPG